jgi:predicted RNase H-like HicB family nuclease
MGRRKVLMEYHCEPEGWWTKSPDLPGFTAAGATFAEVRELAHSGAEFYLREPVEVEDRIPQPLKEEPTS